MKIIRDTLVTALSLGLAFILVSLIIYLGFLDLVIGFFFFRPLLYITFGVLVLVLFTLIVSHGELFRRKPRAYEVDTTITRTTK